MRIVSAAQLEERLDEYLEEAKNGQVLVISKDGKKICEIRPRVESKLAVFDSLTGIASGVDLSASKDERTRQL